MPLVSKFTRFSVTRSPPLPLFPHGGAEGPKTFEFNTSTLLEKALRALPIRLKFEQTFIFMLFIFFGGGGGGGARIWALEFGCRYRIPGIKIPLDTSLRFLFLATIIFNMTNLDNEMR